MECVEIIIKSVMLLSKRTMYRMLQENGFTGLIALKSSTFRTFATRSLVQTGNLQPFYSDHDVTSPSQLVGRTQFRERHGAVFSASHWRCVVASRASSQRRRPPDHRFARIRRNSDAQGRRSAIGWPQFLTQAHSQGDRCRVLWTELPGHKHGRDRRRCIDR